MRVVYYVHEEGEEAIVRAALPGHDLIFKDGLLHETTEVDAQADALCIFINSKVDASVLDRFAKLRFIATRSTGFDHIDLTEAKKRGIQVSNVPTYGVETVAEFAFALLLSLTRKVQQAHMRVRVDGSFEQEGLRGIDLANKTIGIIGTGNIGSHAARIAKGFAMNVVAYDPFPKPDLAEQIGFTYTTLDDLLAQADVISLHAPLLDSTRHLIGAQAVAKMKRGVYFINTARGGLVDTTALIDGIESGIIAGAGLDVMEDEDAMITEERLLAGAHPDIQKLRAVLSGHILAKHPRVILTPHIAFNSQEAIRRIIDTSIENLIAFAQNRASNLVPLPA